MSTGINTEKFIEDVFDKPIVWDRNCPSNKSQVETIWIELAKKYATPINQLKSKWKGLRDMFRVEIKRIPRNGAGDFVIQPHEYDSKWTHYRSLLFLADHMRSRNVKCTQIDPIQKMELVYDTYSYVTNGFNLNERETDAHNPPAVKQEAFDVPAHKFDKKRKKSDLTASPLSSSVTIAAANILQSPDSNPNSLSKKRAITNTAAILPPTTTTSATTVATTATTPSMDFLSATDSVNDIGERIMNDDYHFLLSLQPFMSELSPIQKLRLRMKIQTLVFEELYANENDE